MLPTESASAACTNCGTILHGEYCSECGQRRFEPVHSVWHLIRDAAEDLTHTDSRVWQTLASLAIRPGFLVREYLAGRRARYLPPFRLYLILSIVFFALATASPEHAYIVHLDRGDVRPIQPTDREQICHSDYHGPGARTVQEFMRTRCPQLVSDGGKSLAAAYMHNLPRAMFLFLPLLALFMKAMYWRPRHYYAEHWLFLLYLQSFVFLLFIVGMLAARVLPARLDSALTLVLWLYAIYYLFTSVRRSYAQSRAATALKFVLLCAAYLVSGLIMVTLTTLYSLVMM